MSALRETMELDRVEVSMPLEFSVLIGLGAVVVCALKGHYWWALGIVVALSIAVVGVVSVAEGLEEEAVSGLLVLGVPLVIAAGAVWLSLQGPLPGSYWARLKTTDAAGTRLITKEPGLRRFVRSLIGALVGTLPAIAFMALAILAADTGDEAQLAFAGIPFVFIGFLVGGAIGFHWVPRSATRPPAGPASPLPS